MYEMKRQIVGDMPCPLCREKGRDKTGNHCMIFDDGSHWCNRCETNPVENKNMKIILDDVKTFKTTKMPHRGISLETALNFGVKTGYNGEGKIAEYFYPISEKGKIVSYKVRRLPKEFYSVGESLKGRTTDLMGQMSAKGTRRLLIVEGQDDMLASWQMLNSKYSIDVVSVHGAQFDLSKHKDFISGYEDVVVCFDQDEAGTKAAEKAAQLYETIKIMTIPCKDPNDMLLEGRTKEFITAFFNAKEYCPEGFVTVDDVKEKALKPVEWGRRWPWPSLDRMTYGRRDGEGIYIGAGVKAGKSEWLNEMVKHITKTEQKKVAVFKFEEDPAFTLKKIAGKVMSKQFHIPGGNWTQEELELGIEKVSDKLLMYDSYMNTNWDKIKLAIRHAVVKEGCKDIFLDPITNFTDGMDASQTETKLRELAKELSAMAKDLGFFYYCFCHLKAPHTGKPHEEGGKVHSNQFRGSRAMMEKTHYMLGIERNKMAEDELDRNTSTFVLLENRTYGTTGRFEVFYDNENGDYLET